jgi:phenylacetate-CoA ligase
MIDPFGVISGRLYLPALDRWKGIPYARAMTQARRNERLSRDVLQASADRLLGELLTHACRTTPYYRELFRKLGAEPNDLQGREALRTLPLLTKAHVFDRGDDLLATPFHAPRFRCTTSGSTGVAMAFTIDGAHAAWVEAAVYRGRSWWGLPRGAREVVLWARAVDDSPTKNLRAAIKYRLRNRHQFDTFVDFDDRRAAELVEALRRIRPKVIYGYGSSVGRLAIYMREKGLSLRSEEAPVLVEFTADHMSLDEQEAARHVFRAPVLSAYGASEIGGVAQMCRHGALHIAMDHVVVEVLRPDGEPAGPGELGEIVVTALHNRAMPFIRYAIGDVGRLVEGSCACGSPLPTMVLELGKAVELITTSAVKGMSAHVFDYINLHIMKLGVRGVRQFFVEQTAPDDFVLIVVKDTVFEPASVEMFVAKMREKLGAEIRVDVRFAAEVPRRPSGKRLYFRKVFA